MTHGRIQIIRKINSVIDGRNKVEEQDFFSCWCEISDLLSSEKYEALQMKMEETAVFKVRRCKKIEEIKRHTKEFYAKYKCDLYKIYSVVPVEKESKYLLKVNRIS